MSAAIAANATAAMRPAISAMDMTLLSDFRKDTRPEPTQPRALGTQGCDRPCQRE